LTFRGHGDPASGALLVGEQTREYLYGIEIESLLKTWSDKFSDTAKIELKSCGSANPLTQKSPARAFKQALPEARVYGYTGLLLDIPYILETPVPNMKPFSGFNPFMNPGKAPMIGVPRTSKYIEAP